MKRIFILLIIIGVSMGFTKKILTKEEYKTMPVSDIRNIFLKYTPRESSVEIVKGFIKNNLGKEYDVLEGATRIHGKKYDWSIEEGDFTYIVYLARYGLVKNFFLGGYNVESFWIFNKNGLLKDIIIERSFDGI